MTENLLKETVERIFGQGSESENPEEAVRILRQWTEGDHRDRDPIRIYQRRRLMVHMMWAALEFIRQEGAMAWKDVETALTQARNALSDCAITFVSSVPGSNQTGKTD